MCVQKGEKCVAHGLVGKKEVNSSKIWDRKKNGLLGLKVNTKTTYVCRYRGVAVMFR